MITNPSQQYQFWILTNFVPPGTYLPCRFTYLFAGCFGCEKGGRLGKYCIHTSTFCLYPSFWEWIHSIASNRLQSGRTYCQHVKIYSSNWRSSGLASTVPFFMFLWPLDSQRTKTRLQIRKTPLCIKNHGNHSHHRITDGIWSSNRVPFVILRTRKRRQAQPRQALLILAKREIIRVDFVPCEPRTFIINNTPNNAVACFCNTLDT